MRVGVDAGPFYVSTRVGGHKKSRAQLARERQQARGIVNSCKRHPRLTVSVLTPYVAIGVLLIAFGGFGGAFFGGLMLVLPVAFWIKSL